MMARFPWLRRLWYVSILCLVFSHGLSTALAAPASLLPVDPAIHRGQLDNGVRYWVRSHATPPGKITLWMRVDTGSLNEADGEEGIAHYLEHMAFNGSEYFPPGELLRYFESIGLRFGQHQNAFTTFDQTTYTLSLPDTQPETLDKGLLCLADFAFRMSLLPTEIAKERGVILEEKRARRGVRQRLMDQLFPALLPESRLARRLPIGLEASIQRFQRDDFLAYYSTWYHPARVTILAVGDMPVDTIVAMITRHFSPWQPAAPPSPPHQADLVPFTSPRAIMLTDRELTHATIEAVTIGPRTPRLTVEDYRQALLDGLGTWMVNRRLLQRIHEGTAPYQRADTHIGSFFNVAEQVSTKAEAAPERWAEALTSLLADIQSARQYGFSARELAVAKKALLAMAEHRAQTETTQDAQSFLAIMNHALSAGELPRAAAQTLELSRQLLPDIGVEDVSATFTKRFAPEKNAYILMLPQQEGLPVPDQNTLLALVQETLARPVEPWNDLQRPTVLLAQEPQPGTISERSHFAPLDVTHVTFANNVRLHYRFMDVKKDHVSVTMTLPGGVIQEQAEQRGLTDVAALPLFTPATSQFSSTDIRDLMTGKQSWVRARVLDDAIQLSITGTPADLEEGFRLAYLLLTDARIEPASVALWHSEQLQQVASERTHIGMQAQEAARLVLSGNDPRQRSLTPEQIERSARSIAAAQTWLDTILRSAPIEVGIVGDMPIDRALDLAARYLGSLPLRPRQAPNIESLRQVAGFTGPLTRTIEVETITPRAQPLLMWRSAPWSDVHARRAMFIAARILESRMRQEIREERALTYSTSTFVRPHKAYPAMSALYVGFTADPDKVHEAAAVAKSVVEQFAAEGPTDEEMHTVRKQLRNSLETALKEPPFWVHLLSDLEYHRTALADVDGLIEKLLAFTKAEITAEVRKTVVPERFAMVIAHPKAVASAVTPGQSTVPTNTVQ